MPDNDTKKPRRQLKNIPPDRFQPKVLVFWIILAFAVVALLYWSPGIAVSPAQLTIYEVVTRAEAGDVKVGLIQPDPNGGSRDWVLITGELNDAVLTNERHGKTSAFRAAGRLTDLNMERLQIVKPGKPANDVLVSFLQIKVAARVRGHGFLPRAVFLLGGDVEISFGSGPEKLSSSVADAGVISQDSTIS